MFTALTWGWWPALAAAVAAMLLNDYFFSTPLHTVGINTADEWLEELVFLAVAALTSNLANRERARREEAHRRAEEATLLYELGRALSADEFARALPAVTERLVQRFRLAGCVVKLDGEPRTVPPSAADVAPPGAPLVASPDDPATPVLRIPLRVGGRALGTLRLLGRADLTEQEQLLLETVADQLAATVERERLKGAEEQAELLRRTDQLRQALLSSVSHDLRTPLFSIKTAVDSLRQPRMDWSEAHRNSFLATISRESERLNRMVSNLLEMSRIEGGVLRPRRAWYDLGELTREVVDRLTPVLGGRPVNLVIPDELAPIQIDYLFIDQVLTNLLENAVKYTPLDSEITIEIRQAPSVLAVSVADHGPGIPVAERERVFDKFHRLAPDGTPGSGLGLSVCQGLVQAHSGRIGVDDAPGGGARFWFELPTTVAEPSETSEVLA
jgi:two-component system sensor histidine kinase KdpD